MATLATDNMQPSVIDLSAFLTSDNISALFFKNALQTGSLAHGYVLKGQDLPRMYNAALSIAQVLNCEQRVDAVTACQTCPSCRWVSGNRHPAVLTVSRLTYLVGDNGQDLTLDDLEKLSKKPPQTLIKTEQMGRLIHQLGVSSPHYRVVIFTDAEAAPQTQPGKIAPPYDWAALEANEKKTFHLKPLHRGLFNAESANRFLKTLEEPPAKTLFFFLTDSEDNLLETIVSRCQTVPFIGAPEVDDTANISEAAMQLYASWLSKFQFPKVVDVYPMLQEFDNVLVKGEDLSEEQALAGFQRYLRFQYRQTAQALLPFERYRQIQRAFEQAQSLLHSKANTDQTLQQLFWHLTAKPAPNVPFI